MKRDRDCFQNGGLMKGKIFWKPVSDSGWDRNKLGECAGSPIVSARNAEDLAAVAEIHLSAHATRTRAAVNRGVKRDAVARLKVGHVSANVFYDSSGFMAHHDRWDAAPGRAVVAVNIAAADSAGGYANQQLVSADSRYRNVRDLKMTIFR